MKRIAASIGLLALLLLSHAFSQDAATTAIERAQRASDRDCAKVCFESARQLIELANQQFASGNIEQGQKLIAEAVASARRGTEASVKTHKNQKNAEISLRKMAKRVHDIADSLALDDRPPVMEASKTMERMRDDILDSMFGSPKKSLEEKK